MSSCLEHEAHEYKQAAESLAPTEWAVFIYVINIMIVYETEDKTNMRVFNAVCNYSFRTVF